MGRLNLFSKIGLNLVSKSDYVKPNYPFENWESHNLIKLYYAPKGNVFIVGNVDNNYTYTFSMAKINDKKRLEEIFNLILKRDYSVTTQEYLIWEKMGIEWEEKQNWFSCILRVSEGDVQKYYPHYCDHHYEERIISSPDEFADLVQSLPKEMKAKCREHEAKENCEKKLQKTLQTLENGSFEVFGEWRNSLCEEVRESEYFLFSDNKNIVELYLKCRKLVWDYYNAYMSKYR